MRAFIGLGSNLGDGPAMIRSASAALHGHDSIRVLRMSSLYRTAAWGCTDQPDFTNAVVEIETALDPERLLAVCLQTERDLGRRRSSVRWGPRIIDIDILCCGQIVLRGPDLEVPHPLLHRRAFVMVPLLELEPDLVLPGIGIVRNCLEELKFQGVRLLE
jgi:2-amino-4-hydroxy-6-hydroxymethyldihydropteridine diphosphokinase